MELKSFGENSNGEFMINFDFMKYMDEEEEEKYKGCSFEAMIYDNYIE
jgi:hypothetical protein